jgi:DNA-binding Xre family transcriptional regulator
MEMAIKYYRLFDLLNRRSLKKTDLLTLVNISAPTLAKLSKGETVTTEVISRLCEALSCQPEDIMEYIGNSAENKKITNSS